MSLSPSFKPQCGNCNTVEGCSSSEKSIFCGLESASFDKLNQEKFSRVYKKGQTLFLEGHPQHGIFCINSGKVKLTKGGTDGHEAIVRIAGSGDAIGGVNFLSNKGTYAITATVIEDAMICMIGDNVIKDLLLTDRTLAMNMLCRWDEEMVKAHELMHALTQKNSKARLAYILIYLNQLFGKEQEASQLIDIHLTRDEYAALIGIAPENVIRCFAELKKEEVIFEDKKQIFIKDFDKLKQISNS